MQMVQQVSRKGTVNALSTRFVREDNDAVAARRLMGSQPFGPASTSSPVYREPPVCLGLPARPAHLERNAAAQESSEAAAFDAWLQSVHGRFPAATPKPTLLPSVHPTWVHVVCPSGAEEPRTKSRNLHEAGRGA